MWQKCPICDGEGRVTGNGTTSSVHQVCPTCNGARIISELNGLPPNQSIEIPSDEEIHKQPTNQKINAWHIPDILKSCDKEIEELEKKYLATYGDKDNTAIGFKIGCEWMRDKILNQNK